MESLLFQATDCVRRVSSHNYSQPFNATRSDAAVTLLAEVDRIDILLLELEAVLCVDLQLIVRRLKRQSVVLVQRVSDRLVLSHLVVCVQLYAF